MRVFFRYLRCGMSEVTREQADKLENYVLALGIRGYKKWSEKMGSCVQRNGSGEDTGTE